MSSSSHNRPVSSVIGGASSQKTAANTDKPLRTDVKPISGPGDLPGAYKPSTGRDKSLPDHAVKVFQEIKSQVSHLLPQTDYNEQPATRQIGGNQLFEKADGTEREGQLLGGMLNKYTDEIAPGEGSS